MAVSPHLEHEVLDPPEAEAAVPPGVRQNDVAPARVAVRRFSMSENVDRRPPAAEVNGELEGVQVMAELEVEHGRDAVAPAEEV